MTRLCGCCKEVESVFSEQSFIISPQIRWDEPEPAEQAEDFKPLFWVSSRLKKIVEQTSELLPDWHMYGIGTINVSRSGRLITWNIQKGYQGITPNTISEDLQEYSNKIGEQPLAAAFAVLECGPEGSKAEFDEVEKGWNGFPLVRTKPEWTDYYLTMGNWWNEIF